jgi:hypothetical protein
MKLKSVVSSSSKLPIAEPSVSEIHSSDPLPKHPNGSAGISAANLLAVKLKKHKSALKVDSVLSPPAPSNLHTALRSAFAAKFKAARGVETPSPACQASPSNWD